MCVCVCENLGNFDPIPTFSAPFHDLITRLLVKDPSRRITWDVFFVTHSSLWLFISHSSHLICSLTLHRNSFVTNGSWSSWLLFLSQSNLYSLHSSPPIETGKQVCVQTLSFSLHIYIHTSHLSQICFVSLALKFPSHLHGQAHPLPPLRNYNRRLHLHPRQLPRLLFTVLALNSRFEVTINSAHAHVFFLPSRLVQRAPC